MRNKKLTCCGLSNGRAISEDDFREAIATCAQSFSAIGTLGIP